MTINYTPIERKVQADYDAIAASFGESRRNLHWAEVDQMLADIKPGETILDVGCGTGRLCSFVQDKHVDYIGVDISQKMLEVAKRDCAQGKFLQASMLRLPFTDHTFDRVFSIAALHHLATADERLAALRESVRVLKPGGKLYLTVMGLWLPRYWKNRQGAFNEVSLPWIKQAGVNVDRYYHAFTKRELRRLLRQAGFLLERLSYQRDGKTASWLWGKNLVAVADKVIK